MQVTISQLQEWYKEFNQKVFEFDMPKVTFILTNTRRQLGQASRRGTSYTIKVSNFFDRDRDSYRNTLLHEMCHIWCYFHGYRDDHHTGPQWCQITDKAYMRTGILITRTTDGSQFKPAKGNEAKLEAVKAKREAPSILVDIDYGTHHFIVKTTKKVIWDNSDGKTIKTYGGGKVSGVYVCDDPLLHRWVTTRVLHRGYKYSNANYKQVIIPILNAGIKVDDLRSLCRFGEYDCLGIR